MIKYHTQTHTQFDGEFESTGSLDKLLFDSRLKLRDERKIDLVRGIAAGMLHLHKHNIVHRDLAARNILLTSGGDPKISVLFLSFCVSLLFCVNFNINGFSDLSNEMI
jgi:serine/threonine protein kinase